MINDLQDILPLGPGVQFIDFDPASTLFALDKPVGVKSHPNEGRPDKNALLFAHYSLKHRYYHKLPVSSGSSNERSKWEAQKVYLLNRLDSPTSGLILLALDPKVVKIVKELFRAQKVKKTYQALVKGRPKDETWTDFLEVIKKNGKLRTQRARGGDLAKTSIKLVSYDTEADISKVELTPHTGRTHQLRVQCALHGYPILGDKTYGDFPFNKLHKSSCMFLHSSKIEISDKNNFGPKGVVFCSINNFL